jgi:hypothetical protein
LVLVVQVHLQVFDLWVIRAGHRISARSLQSVAVVVVWQLVATMVGMVVPAAVKVATLAHSAMAFQDKAIMVAPQMLKPMRVVAVALAVLVATATAQQVAQVAQQLRITGQAQRTQLVAVAVAWVQSQAVQVAQMPATVQAVQVHLVQVAQITLVVVVVLMATQTLVAAAVQGESSFVSLRPI